MCSMPVSDSPTLAPAGCNAEGGYYSRLPTIRLTRISGAAHLQAGYAPQIAQRNFPIDIDTNLRILGQVGRGRHCGAGFA
jgi:hypothetical protein